MPIAPTPLHQRWWFRIVIAVGVVSAVAFVLLVAVVAAEIQKEEEINARIAETAVEGCEEAVTDYAKHPAAAKFDDPLAPLPENAESHQGSSSTEFITVNLGTVQFVNGFGVPSPYYFGCVSYHDADGELLSTRAKVEEGETYFDRVSYDYATDRLN